MIVVSCTCGERFKAKAEHAGKRTKCPACGSAIRIPSEERERREVHSARPHFVDSVAEAIPVDEVLTLEGAPIMGPRKWQAVIAIRGETLVEVTTSTRYGIFGFLMPPPKRMLSRTMLLSEVGQVDVANRLDPRGWIILLLAFLILMMVGSVLTFVAGAMLLVMNALGGPGVRGVTVGGTLARMIVSGVIFSLGLMLYLYIVHQFRLISVVIQRKRPVSGSPLAAAAGPYRPLGVRFPGVEPEEALALGEAFTEALTRRCVAGSTQEGAGN